MITHLVLDSPSIPDHFYLNSDYVTWSETTVPKEQSLNVSKKDYGTNDFRDRLVDCRGEVKPVRSQFRYSLGEEFDTWIKQTFSEPDEPDDWFMDSGFTFLLGPNGDEDTCGPHTDTRIWHLFYLIESGGNPTTEFWVEKDKPILRGSLITTNTYDNLMLIERTVFPEKKWIIMNSRMLHSVENLKGMRTSIQVSMHRLPNKLKSLISSTIQPVSY
jgi:hypothetical protein